jgi:hypothetical protein
VLSEFLFRVSLVAIFLPLLVVCPPSPCGELRGCILVVVGWRLRVKCVCFLLRAHTPLKQKKNCTCYQSCCRNKEESPGKGVNPFLNYHVFRYWHKGGVRGLNTPTCEVVQVLRGAIIRP